MILFIQEDPAGIAVSEVVGEVVVLHTEVDFLFNILFGEERLGIALLALKAFFAFPPAIWYVPDFRRETIRMESFLAYIAVEQLFFIRRQLAFLTELAIVAFPRALVFLDIIGRETQTKGMETFRTEVAAKEFVGERAAEVAHFFKNKS